MNTLGNKTLFYFIKFFIINYYITVSNKIRHFICVLFEDVNIAIIWDLLHQYINCVVSIRIDKRYDYV